LSNPPKFFPFDEDYRFDFYAENTDFCPHCHELFSEHSKSQLVKCALTELGGD